MRKLITSGPKAVHHNASCIASELMRTYALKFPLLAFAPSCTQNLAIIDASHEEKGEEGDVKTLF